MSLRSLVILLDDYYQESEINRLPNVMFSGGLPFRIHRGVAHDRLVARTSTFCIIESHIQSVDFRQSQLTKTSNIYILVPNL